MITVCFRRKQRFLGGLQPLLEITVVSLLGLAEPAPLLVQIVIDGRQLDRSSPVAILP
jgi:hypothetical protein